MATCSKCNVLMCEILFSVLAVMVYEELKTVFKWSVFNGNHASSWTWKWKKITFVWQNSFLSYSYTQHCGPIHGSTAQGTWELLIWAVCMGERGVSDCWKPWLFCCVRAVVFLFSIVPMHSCFSPFNPCFNLGSIGL